MEEEKTQKRQAYREKLPKAVELAVLKNYSNIKICDELGIPRSTLQTWQKKKEWKEEEERIHRRRAKMIVEQEQKDREDYKSELRRARESLKQLMNGHLSVAAQSLYIVQSGYKKLGIEEDPIKAAAAATRSGLDKQWRSVQQGTEMISRLINQVYEIGEVLDYFDQLNEDNAEE